MGIPLPAAWIMIGGRVLSLDQLLAMAADLEREVLRSHGSGIRPIAVTGSDPLSCWLAALCALGSGRQLILGSAGEGNAIPWPHWPKETADLAIPPTQASAPSTMTQTMARIRANLGSALPQVALATSGSTGEPTLVWKSWQVLAAEALCLSRFYPKSRGPIVSLVPPQHIYGLLHSILLPLWSQRPVIQVGDVSLGLCPREQDALAKVSAAGQGSGALLVTTPASWSRAEQLITSGQVSAMVSSAGAFGEKRHHQLQRIAAGRDFRAVEIYGSTETGGLAWQDLMTLGGFTPFPDVSLSFSGADAECAIAHSPYIYPEGRWQLEDRLAKAQDGRFRVLGRRDQVFKYGGKRYSLRTVAAKLAAAAEVDPAQVVCDFEKDEDLPKGGILWGFIGAAADEALLRARYLDRDSSQEQSQGLPYPDRLLLLTELPRSAVGKVSMAELRRLRRERKAR